MTTSSLYNLFDQLKLKFSFSVDEAGLCHIATKTTRGAFIERIVDIKDGIAVLSTAIPELVEDTSTALFSGRVNVFPEFVVKTTEGDDARHLMATLYSSYCRRTMKMKWRHSSESPLDNVVGFLSALRSIVGDDAYVEKWKSLGITVDLGDLSMWEVPNFLYPPLVGCLSMVESSIKGVYNFNNISYYTYQGSKEQLLLPSCTHGYISSNRDKFNAVPLPNFFSSNNMCFGSITKPPGLDVKKSWSSLDFYLRIVYMSSFNTDLYDYSRFKKWDEVYEKGLNLESVLVRVFGLTKTQSERMKSLLSEGSLGKCTRLMSQIIFCASTYAAY